jgi:uncharacterized protein with GYD domain
MVARPEDRAEQVSRLMSRIGGRLIGYYMTFGDYVFWRSPKRPTPCRWRRRLLRPQMVEG